MRHSGLPLSQVRRILIFSLIVSGLAAAQAPPLHPIAVRVGNDGVGEFYDRTTNVTFTPRGNNYVRLADLPLVFGGHGVQHALLVPGIYDPVAADNALSAMNANGYNTVRIFLAPGCTTCMGNIQGPGLNSAYMDNLVDFLGRAKSHSIFVVLTTDYPPDAGGYLDPLGTADPNLFAGDNLRYLPTGGVQSDQNFWHDFVQYLINAQAATDTILGYELRNEQTFISDAAPLSLAAGMVTTANGLIYDMSNAAAKQQMLQDGLTYWLNAQTATIKALDPTALVTAGFFDPQGPNPDRIGDDREVVVYPAVANANIDFVDLHPYPGINLTLPQYVQNFGSGPFPQKPLLMGEFGAFTQFFPNAQNAADALRQWQVASCPLNFRGWLLWTWNEPQADQQPQPLWNALDDLGQVNATLRPISRPNPCLPSNTIISLTVAPNTPMPGQTVRLTASVASSAGGIASGTITFKDGTATLATLPIPTGSPIQPLAVANVTFSAGGLHWITASYSGDSANSAGVSLPVAMWVNTSTQTATAIGLGLVSVPPFRQTTTGPATVTFRVSSHSTLGLSVSLYDGTQPLGTGTVSGGSGNISVSLPYGQHNITAVCPAGKGFNGSVSAPISVYVFR